MVALSAGLGALSGCGSQQEPGDGARDVGTATNAASTKAQAHRARQVAAAWDGSAAAAAWRSGYHPIDEVVQLPRGGLRDAADRRAFRDHRFALRAKLPSAGPAEGRVAWERGGSLTRPLEGAKKAYNSLADTRKKAEPSLTVTEVKLGTMRVATSRGTATIPAWLFSLDGYDSPLKRAAVRPSQLPRPPIGRDGDVPGLPLHRLVRVSPDGRAVSVVALHGACDDGAAVHVRETSGSVVLSPSVKGQRTGPCTKQAKLQKVTVTLDRPVGDRVLLDAVTGKPVPYKSPHRPSPSWS
ncbi:hypothetical protein [Streptomyces albiaxialis]|uniref:hypothetical protein n=1 Tax=Streptomyces albiaxialis TaxID=329523 RepID=UPI0031D4C3FF